MYTSLSGTKSPTKAVTLGSKADHACLPDRKQQQSGYHSIDTHWLVGMDYYNQSDVECTIRKINFFEEENLYQRFSGM